MRLHRCRVTVSEHGETLNVKNVLQNFVRLEYRNDFQTVFRTDRRNGTIDFTLPDLEFVERYKKLDEYLKRDDMKKHFKRTKIMLGYTDAIDI